VSQNHWAQLTPEFLDTIITAFPERWTQIFPPELKNWIIKGRPELCDTLDGLTACIVQQTVGFVQEPWNCGLDEHVLDIFARKIAELVRYFYYILFLYNQLNITVQLGNRMLRWLQPDHKKEWVF
jgi:hypothetical protein